MLKTLQIKNLILIEEAMIEFDRGFTVITGETGAGKTALVEALRLLCGERGDSTKVRKGASRAWIGACFSFSPPLSKIFEEFGLSHPENEDVLITREISREGKSRCFVSGQMVPVSFLQELSPFLLDFVGQHATTSLKSLDKQREYLDVFAEIDLFPFQKSWKEEKNLEAELSKLKAERENVIKRRDFLEEKCAELLAAKLKEGEENALFEEYTVLSNSQELERLTDQSLEAADTVLDGIRKVRNLLMQMEKCGLEAKEEGQIAKEIDLQGEELRSLLLRIQAKWENDPQRLHFLEERLSFLEKLKKKHGPDLFLALEEAQSELDSLQNFEDKQQQLTNILETSRLKSSEAIKNIRIQREAAARKLETILSHTLQELNIPTAEVVIQIKPCARTQYGEDEIAFFLRANKGEKLSSVRENTSGGELSRLLFALKLALGEKRPANTMVFDEIDANVGGETATQIGKYLFSLGKKGQILCITHFPQVARQADHHFCVVKKENADRTLGMIHKVSGHERDLEITRMLGGLTIVTHTR